MKKIRNFLLLCLIAIMATGCIKYNAKMTIKNDKSMDFTIIYAVDTSLMGESGSLKEEQFDNLKKEGYTLEKYSEGNYQGFKIIKKINNIDEVSTDKDVEFNLSDMMNEVDKYIFKVVKDGDKSTYYANFKFDSNNNSTQVDDSTNDETLAPDENDETVTTGSDDDSSSSTGLDDMDLSGLTGSMDLSFSVELPSSAISSNATTKENNDKNLTWKLEYGKANEINFAFTIDPNAKGDSNLLLYVGIGVGVLVLLVIIILLTRKGGKKEVVANDNQVEIKNDVKEEVTPGPELKEEAQVMDEAEQKDSF